MKNCIVFLVFCACLPLALPAFGNESDDLITDQMLSDIQSKLQLSKEKLDKLKPVVAAKSAELQKAMHDSIDKGFAELEKLSSQLETLSKNAMTEMEETLTGEEMQQLREYMGKFDKESVDRVKDTLVAELCALLKLTEEQAIKLKPLVEDSFVQLSRMIEQFSQQGTEGLTEFKAQYDNLLRELREKLGATLNRDQMDSLDKHNEKLKEKVMESAIAI